jgi:hypothetical protein
VGVVIIVEHGVCDIRRRPINVRERTGPRPKKERRLFAAGDRPVVQCRGKGAKGRLHRFISVQPLLQNINECPMKKK